MKSNALQASIIKAGLLLLVFSLLVYFTATSPDSGVWGAFGQVIVTFIQTIQFAIGLALGLLVCLAVMIGIFLAGVSMVSSRTAGAMYEGLRCRIMDWVKPIQTMLVTNKQEKMALIHQEIAQPLEEELQKLQRAQVGLQQQFDDLDSKLMSAQTALRTMAPAEQVEGLDAKVGEAGETIEQLQESFAGIKTELDKTSKQVAAVDPKAILGDLPERLAEVESREEPEAVEPVDISPLESKIGELEDAIAALKEETAAAAAAAAEKAPVEELAAADTPAEDTSDASEPEYRIFSYIEDKGEQDHVASLVDETLDKDMSYAQVISHLEKNLKPETAKEVTDHPSLIKEFIRFRRKQA